MTRKTRQISVGRVKIGGGAPVSVQSMTNTRTDDIDATCAQIEALTQAGCDIVRCAVPDMAAAQAIVQIKRRAAIPVVADIHFDHKLAIAAVESGADKIRINPGNIGGAERLRAVADCCRERGIPIRVGVNTGSIEKEILDEHGRSPQALVLSAIKSVQMLEDANFFDICVSLKSSDVRETFEAYMLLSEKTDCPLHIGVTEAGTARMGVIKSAVGIGSLLMNDIGDTLRVSLTADPVLEVEAGIAILRAAGIRKRCVNVVSCPTCGRTRISLIPLVEQVEKRLEGLERDITVAVMGCVVNGPGEAKHADYGIAGGEGFGIVFKKGEIVGKFPDDRLCDELMNIIAND